MKLLTRGEFSKQVLARSRGKCVFCSKPAVDPHHILERKLFAATGGYYLENGAAVCADHHWQCETTEISTEEVRAAAGITECCLPPDFDMTKRYDKWGNVMRPDGLREPGPLFNDTGCRKSLAAGGVLALFVPEGTPDCRT